jgi:hypothetical protein
MLTGFPAGSVGDESLIEIWETHFIVIIILGMRI